MLSSKLEKILISKKKKIQNCSKNGILIGIPLKPLLTSYSTATLLLTRSVVVIATAAESALGSHNETKNVYANIDIPHRRQILELFADIKFTS